MERIPETELMDNEAQARAYAQADFAAPHDMFVELLRQRLEGVGRHVLDLGCGPADVTLRFAQAFAETQIDGVDGAAAMLRFGNRAVEQAGLTARVRLVQGYLPGAALPRERYDLIISNSLLHHLANPLALWSTIHDHLSEDGQIFVMDLIRPADEAIARQLVETYAAAEPEVLRHDFYQSLLAAWRPAEVEAQLLAAGLAGLAVETVSDRHLLVWGKPEYL